MLARALYFPSGLTFRRKTLELIQSFFMLLSNNVLLLLL